MEVGEESEVNIDLENCSDEQVEGRGNGISSKFMKFCEEWIPPNWLYSVLVRILIPVLIWLVAYLLVGESALPSGQIWALLVILFFGIAFGQVFWLIKLPHLLGMLTLGIIVRNVPGIDFGNDVTPQVSSVLRQLALTIILICTGLALDPEVLMRLKGVVILLTFLPCLAEACVIGFVSHFILGFTWQWGLLLGFVLAAVSPGVSPAQRVPSLLSERGDGVDKGNPNIAIAASLVDDILVISAFGLVLGFTFPQGTGSIEPGTQGPLELLLGIAFGIGFGVIWGSILGIFFAKEEKTDKSVMITRVLLILGGGCLSVFGFPLIGFPGSGALGCLAATFIAAVFWRKKKVLKDNDNLSEVFSLLWFIVQPLLFGLIGCEIDLKNINWDVVTRGLVCLGSGLLVRMVVTHFTLICGRNSNGKIYLSFSWVPKSFLQAAMGSIALDTARTLNAGPESEQLGLQVLTIAVLTILIMSPVNAITARFLLPKLRSNNGIKSQNNVRKDGIDEV